MSLSNKEFGLFLAGAVLVSGACGIKKIDNYTDSDNCHVLTMEWGSFKDRNFGIEVCDRSRVSFINKYFER